MATKEKNVWILLLIILSGIVLGSLVGQLASQVDALWWLGYGGSYGLSSPLVLDLGVMSLTFAVTIQINVASILGIAVALFVYRKI